MKPGEVKEQVVTSSNVLLVKQGKNFNDKCSTKVGNRITVLSQHMVKLRCSQKANVIQGAQTNIIGKPAVVDKYRGGNPLKGT